MGAHVDVHARTILTAATRDVKGLPLDALEAFVLSQIDGRLTLEEIAEVVGVDLDKAARIVRRLLVLDAVSAAGDATMAGPEKTTGVRKRFELPPSTDEGSLSGRRSARPDPRAEECSARRDPRAETEPPPSLTRRDPRAETEPPPSLTRPVRHSTPVAAKPVAERRPASVPSPAPVDDDACDLDAVTQAEIVALDARRSLDHYAVLGVERFAEKRDIKRAYFAFASKFHPDRFFGKKLGKLRVTIERLFARLTEAHDTLSSSDRRAQYDAKLPGAAQAAKAAPTRKRSQAAIRRASRAMMSAAMQPAPAPSFAPAPSVAVTPSFAPAPSVAVTPSVAPSPDSKMRKLSAIANGNMMQGRADLFLRAAEEALRVDDVIEAANHYRLALQIVDDPFVREKLGTIEDLAKSRLCERSLVRGRAAERDKKWAAAATHFSTANDMQPDAWTAERAAHALRMSEGDLTRAAELAEYAVARSPNNADYRMTLCEIFLSANLLTRASAESARALELSPKDARARRLAAVLSKMT